MRSVPQRGSAWLRVAGVDLRSFRKPDPLATRYRAVVLTASKHDVLLLRQGNVVLDTRQPSCPEKGRV